MTFDCGSAALRYLACFVLTGSGGTGEGTMPREARCSLPPSNRTRGFPAPAIQAILFWLDDGQTFHLGEMPFVERGHAATTLQSCGRHDHVMETNHFSG